MNTTAARVSIAAVITYQALLIALIFIRPDLDPSWHTISEWAIGRLGWIMQGTFLISALSYTSLLIAVKSESRGWWGKMGLAILLICAIGTFGVGVFITDPMPLTRAKGLTTTGALHLAFGGSALMLLPIAALLINLNLALRNPAWAPARLALLWTAFLPLAAEIGFILQVQLVVMPMGPDAYGPGVPLGWPPRLVLLSYGVWIVVLARLAQKQQIWAGRDKPGQTVAERPH